MKDSALLEIRLDRRQAFYAVVGSLLIVSVAFVVGLIIGQRMQACVAEAALPAAGQEIDELLTVAASVEEEPEPQVAFTFYDELGGSTTRPTPVLLPRETATEGPPPTDTDQRPQANAQGGQIEGPQAENDTPDSPAPPAPTDAVVEREQAAEPGPPAQPERDPTMESESGAIRRTVVRIASSDDGAEPEEFGYFSVEAGRFSSFDEADAVREALSSADHEAIVTLLGADGSGRRFRVQVGDFTRRSEAQAVAAEVRTLGHESSVIDD